MKSIIAIAINTFRETIRDKVLYGILFFAVMFILFTMVLGELSLNEDRRVITDTGLAGISLMSLLIAVVVGASMLHKEIDKKTLYPILSKPVARWQFVIGKYLGMNFTLFIQIVLMGVVFLVVLYSKGGDITPSIMITFYLIMLEVLLVTSIAILFSSFSTPFVSGVMTLGVFIVGRNVDVLQSFIRKGSMGVLGKILSAVPHIFPNLYLFYPSGKAVGEEWISIHYKFVTLEYIANVTGYGLLYTSLCLLLGILIFSRRDFI